MMSTTTFGGVEERVVQYRTSPRKRKATEENRKESNISIHATTTTTTITSAARKRSSYSSSTSIYPNLNQQYITDIWNSANERLEKLAGEEDSENRTSKILIASGITLQSYDAWERKTLKKLHRSLDKKQFFYMADNGNVYFYEVPLDPHERTAFEVMYRIREEWGAYGVADLAIRMGGYGSSVGWIKEPDGCFTPNGLVVGGGGILSCDAQNKPWPTLIIEVGYSETIQDLYDDAQLWLGPTTSVQIVLAFKIWRKREDNTVAMMAMRFERGKAIPQYSVSFGNANLDRRPKNTLNDWGVQCVGVGCGNVACDANSIGMYQLYIPTALLFRNVASGIPVGLSANLSIDLYPLQIHVLSAF